MVSQTSSGKGKVNTRLGPYLYRAALRGDWKAAKTALSQDKNIACIEITERGDRALHIAAAAKQTSFVHNLVEHLNTSDLELQNTHGNTAFCFAAESFMGNPKDEDPFAGLVNVGPSSEYWQPKIHNVTNSSPILDVKSVTLAVTCPSCEEHFNVRANLTAVTETAAAATAEMGFNATGASFPVHENRKLKSDNKTRNKGRLKVVAAAAADRNYTPPKSAGKRGHAYDSDSDSMDDPPSSKKSKVVNRHLKFNN
ncbi:unnamed protein product [Fraxinus pennsylvanica]|uniref:Uncharacterized protein n=1 Tax=Fraxinus pennsylvanica TaxID=56036 RepID=A0AAD2DZB9_9LAMI|nr:unnamed protein product [Fraxinus pennsylvanica]